MGNRTYNLPSSLPPPGKAFASSWGLGGQAFIAEKYKADAAITAFLVEHRKKTEAATKELKEQKKKLERKAARKQACKDKKASPFLVKTTARFGFGFDDVSFRFFPSFDHFVKSGEVRPIPRLRSLYLIWVVAAGAADAPPGTTP